MHLWIQIYRYTSDLAWYNKSKLRNNILACRCKVSKLVLVCVKVTHLCLLPFCFLAVQTIELLPLKTKTHLAAQPKQVIREFSMLLIYSFITIATILTNIFNTHHVMYHCKKMKFFIKDFISKCDQIRSFLRNYSHLLKKSPMKIFIFCAVHLFAMIFFLDFFYVICLDDESKIYSIQDFHIDVYGKHSTIATITITIHNFYCVYLHWLVKLSIKDICKLEK